MSKTGKYARDFKLVRAVGQPFVITPLSVLAAGSLPQREQAGGSAIFNIMRNLGHRSPVDRSILDGRLTATCVHG